jgi:hypothetical protein
LANRDSPTGNLRLHIATFDAEESEDYNRENFNLAGQLIKTQPGVTVRYWCEKDQMGEQLPDNAYEAGASLRFASASLNLIVRHRGTALH